CRTMFTFDAGRAPPEAFATIEEVEPRSLDQDRHENYLCVHVKNVPGVLGRVASCLGTYGVSIKQVKQDPRGFNVPVEMVIVTEMAADAKLDRALAELDTFPDVIAPTHRFRLREPDPVD